MLPDEDRAWLKSLHAELWPPQEDEGDRFARTVAELLGTESKPKPPEPRKLIDREELTRIFGLVETSPLVTVLIPHGMMCGVGLQLYEHEQFPGSGPEPLLQISDDHIPRLDDRSIYDHMLGVRARAQEPKGGDVRQDVWDLFTKYTHSDRNREWIKQYGIHMHFDKVHFDY